MLNKHCWNWFYINVNKEVNRFYGVEVKFIYCGVVLTSTIGSKRAEFCGDDFIKLYNDIVIYLSTNYKRRVAVIKIKHKK